MNTAIVLGCASSLIGCVEPTTCQPTFHSDQTNESGMIASGQELIAVLSYPELGVVPPFAAIVSQSGAISTPVRLPSGFDRDFMVSATGHESALWLAQAEGGLDAAVLHDGAVTPLAISSGIAGISTFTSAVVFDGHEYQVFWLDNDRLQHRRVSEQGVPGRVHDLAPVPNAEAASLFAVTDHAGAIYVIVGPHIFAVDPNAGVANAIWSDLTEEYRAAFWLAGEVHLRHDVWTDQIESFDPATRHWRVRAMPPELDRMELFPTETNVYAWDYVGAMFELDPNLVVRATHVVGPAHVGTLGSDWVTNAKLGLDAATRTPGRVRLTRGVSGGKDIVWQTDVVIDSAVVVGEACSHGVPAE